jgi:hypothetical protein
MQTLAVEAPAMPRRDITIDFLRGLALAVMTVDHLRNHWLNFFTYRAAGFFCAAFVFVFLSGYVTGKVYSRYLLQDGFAAALRRMWVRAGKLYGVHVLLGVSLILAGQFFPSLVAPFGREVDLLASSPMEALAATLLLMPCAPILDILPVYVVLLAAAPFALAAFYRGQAKPMLLAGFLIWAAAQGGYSLPLPPYANGFDGASWQFLFLLALYLGYRQQVQPFEKPTNTHNLNLALFGCMVALFMLRHAEVFELIRFREAIPAWWTDKVHCGPLSLLNLLLWVSFFWLVPAPLSVLARQGRVFVAMGRNSLAVFVWHTVLVYAFMAIFPGLQKLSILGQALVVALAVVCLVFPLSVTVHKRLPASGALFTV